MAHQRTQQCRRLKWIFTILHFLFLLGPMLYYIPTAFAAGETIQKISIGFGAIFCIALGAFSLFVEVSHRSGFHRSIVWILVLLVTWCLEGALTFILIIAVTSIIDELVLIPLMRHYKAALIANKEIDRR